ncbi:PAS domain S-box protein [Sediminibacterium sp.]|uniref:PAS domain S-box protein n=1 Tax=Sediminibacterium sp. TaxID=1917865 RepID=UPI0025DDB8F5|nr:PAS domain S-box protein [Sediminibacterium sp.]
MDKSNFTSDLEQDFMLLFENVAQGVIYLNKDGKIEEANPAAIDLLGLSHDQIIGVESIDERWETIRPDFSVFPGKEHPAIVALNTGKPVFNTVMGVKHAVKKKYVWILINAVPEFKQEESTPYRVFTTFTDITDQIELESKLRQRNKLLHLVSNISQQFINIPLNHLEQEINRAIKEIGEFSKADRLAIYDYDFKNGMAYYSYEWCAKGIESKKEELATIPLNAFTSWIEILQKGNPINIPNSDQLEPNSPIRILLDSGKVISLLAIPLMDGDICIGVIGLESVNRPHYFTNVEQDLLGIFAELLVNVKNRIANELKIKESEIKYREITENMSDMVWAMDLNFKVTFCSASIIKIFGFTAEEFLNLEYDQIYPTDTIQKIQSLLGEINECRINHSITSNMSWTIEGDSFKKDGTNAWFRTEIKPHFSEEGILKGYIATTRDETIRKKADDELRKSRYELGERLKEQSCVYNITTLSQSEALTPVEYFGEICNIIPPGFQDIHHTYIHINYEGVNYYSSNFETTENFQKFDIKLASKSVGFINIYLPLNLPFLKEEIIMMNTIIGIIEKYKQVKYTKRQITASEQKFRIIANNTYNWEFWEAPDGHFIYHSPSCKRVTGYLAEELINDEVILQKLIHPDDYDKYIEHRSLVSKHQHAEKLLFRIINKNGEIRIIEHVCQPIFSEQGVYLGTRGTNLDITESKKAETALLESKEIYRSLVESSDAAIIMLDVNGKFLYVNEIAAKTFGRSPSDFLEEDFNITDLASPEVASQNMADIEQVFFSRKGIVKESTRLINGQPIWFRSSIQPVRDSNGNVYAVLVNATNITEQKLSEEKVKLSELKYRTLFAESPDGFLIVKEGIFIDCNKASELILGATKEYIIGKKPTDISPTYQPNGRLSEELVKEVIEAAISKGNTQFEWTHLKVDGTPVIVDIKLSVVNANGENLLFTTWRDVTTQREAELLIKKLQSAVEQSPISIFITDIDGNIEYVNPFTLSVTGYSYEELIGQNPRLLKSGFTNPKVYDELWKTITNGFVWRGVLNNRRKNGSLYWESTTITPIINEVGTITSFIAIKEDITERIKIEHEIKQLNVNLEKKIADRTIELQNSNSELTKAKIEAEEANHAKSEFLSRMSHELRTPMNAILGFAQLLEMGSLDAKQEKAVHHILNSGKHLLNLINEVLEISRIEAGKVSISVEAVKLNNVFRDVIETLTPTAEAYGVKLINELEDKADIFISADKQRIKQVLLNLLNNAIKYNKKQGWVKLFVTEISNDTKSNIRICVSDNGPGIEANNIKKLFTPFERLGAENSAVEGTGLGLSVVQQYASLMGGTSGVESRLNEGSTFWVELPKTSSVVEALNVHAQLEQLPVKEKNIEEAVVLYIEDNSSNIELVSQILLAKRPTIKLVTAVYGKQTLKLALEHKPNLILLDLNLPDIHGSEVFEILKLHETARQIPVIVVSADAMPAQVNKLLQAGVKQYLTKPFDVPAFLKIIDQYTVH